MGSPHRQSISKSDDFVHVAPVHVVTSAGLGLQNNLQFNQLNYERLESTLLQENCIEMREALFEKQPRLANVYAAFDLAMPTATHDAVRFGGLVVQGAIRHSTCAQPSHVAVTEIGNTGEAPNVQPDRASGLLSRLFSWSSNAAPAEAESRFVDVRTSLQQSDVRRGSTKPKNFLLPIALRQVVAHLPDAVLQNLFEINQGQLDLSPRAEGAILEFLANPANQVCRVGDIPQQDLALKETYALFPSDSGFMDSVLKPEFQQFRSVVSWLANVKDPRPNAAVSRFPVCKEMDLVDVIEHTQEKSSNPEELPTHLETLLPGLKRNQQIRSGECAPWVMETEDYSFAFDNINEVVSWVYDNASRHLTQSEESAALAGEVPYPMLVYKILSPVAGKPIPSWLVKAEESALQRVDVAKVNFAQRQQAAHESQERVAQQVAIDKAEAAVNAAALNQLYIEFGLKHGVEPRLEYTTLAQFSAQREIQSRSGETLVKLQHAMDIYSDEYINGVGNQLLEGLGFSHRLQDVSSCTRHQAVDLQSQIIRKDNHCWLRAAWLSVFSQIESADAIESAIRSAFNPDHLDGRLSILKTITQTYLENPESMTHYDFEDPERHPLHFRSGEKLQDFYQSRCIPLPALGPRQGYVLRYTIEDELKHVTLKVAAGFRQPPPCRFMRELVGLNSALGAWSLATSDVPLALHRGLGLPCVVIEKKRAAGITLRIAAPNGHALNAVSNDLLEKEQQGSLTPQQLEPLMEQVKHLPVIMLQEDHFQVFMPKTAAVVDEALPQAPADVPPPLLPPLAPAQNNIPDLLSGPDTFTEQAQQQEADLNAISTIVECPIHSQVQVDFEEGQHTAAIPLHANRIDYSANSKSIVGQSPHGELPMKANLLAALHSAECGGSKGLFHFISPLAMARPEQSKCPGIAYQIGKAFAAQGNRGVIEFGKYKLCAIHEIPQHSQSTWIKHYALDFEDEQGRPVQLKLVEASPDYSKQTISKQDLKESFAALGQIEKPVNANEDNMILSAVGIGRSAALSVYSHVHAEIKSGRIAGELALENCLREAIKAGRRDRGSHFLGNTDQIKILRKALLEELRTN